MKSVLTWAAPRWAVRPLPVLSRTAGATQRRQLRISDQVRLGAVQKPGKQNVSKHGHRQQSGCVLLVLKYRCVMTWMKTGESAEERDLGGPTSRRSPEQTQLTFTCGAVWEHRKATYLVQFYLMNGDVKRDVKHGSFFIIFLNSVDCLVSGLLTDLCQL